MAQHDVWVTAHLLQAVRFEDHVANQPPPLLSVARLWHLFDSYFCAHAGTQGNEDRTLSACFQGAQALVAASLQRCLRELPQQCGIGELGEARVFEAVFGSLVRLLEGQAAFGREGKHFNAPVQTAERRLEAQIQGLAEVLANGIEDHRTRGR